MPLGRRQLQGHINMRKHQPVERSTWHGQSSSSPHFLNKSHRCLCNKVPTPPNIATHLFLISIDLYHGLLLHRNATQHLHSCLYPTALANPLIWNLPRLATRPYRILFNYLYYFYDNSVPHTTPGSPRPCLDTKERKSDSIISTS